MKEWKKTHEVPRWNFASSIYQEEEEKEKRKSFSFCVKYCASFIHAFAVCVWCNWFYVPFWMNKKKTLRTSKHFDAWRRRRAKERKEKRKLRDWHENEKKNALKNVWWGSKNHFLAGCRFLVRVSSFYRDITFPHRKIHSTFYSNK